MLTDGLNTNIPLYGLGMYSGMVCEQGISTLRISGDGTRTHDIAISEKAALSTELHRDENHGYYSTSVTLRQDRGTSQHGYEMQHCKTHRFVLG